MYYRVRPLIIYMLLLIPLWSFSQLGGSTTYEFTNTSSSAREHALGSATLSLDDGDVALALKNPSLLDSTYAGGFSASWGSIHILQTDIGFGSFSYAREIGPLTALFGFDFFNYGRFRGFDEDGNPSNTFFASDYTTIFGASYELRPRISAGFAMKPVFSFYESYSSFGLLHDLAISYKNKEEGFSSSFIIRNVGWQITSYADYKEPIPYSIDIAVSKKLAHAPFRISAVYKGLQKFDLSYDRIFDSQNTLITEDEEEESPSSIRSFTRNAINHIHLGGEFQLFNALHFYMGYDFRKAYEMSYGPSNKGVGFSYGVHIKLSYLTVTYGWAKQHIAGSTHYFTFATNIHTVYNRFTK